MIRRLARALLLALLVCRPAVARAQPAVEYYHLDALGSVRAVTSEAGTVVRRHDYFPFGEEYLAQPGTDPVRFAGKERDAETNLDYVGARYYASRTGRLTTVDPGHVGGNIFDPQSWNAYAYARNNPLRFVDPTGTDYIIAVEGGDPFWFDQGFGDYGALDRYLRGQGFRPLGSSDWGYILNTAGQIVAEYSYFSRSARVFGGAGLLAGGWLNEQLSDMAVSTAIAATGGLAAGAFGGGLAATSTLGLGGEVVSTPLIKGAIIEGFKVGNHVARKAGLGRGATTEIVRATIRGAKAAGTITNEVGTGRFAGNAIQVFVHNGVKVVVDTTSKTIMSVQKLGGFYF